MNCPGRHLPTFAVGPQGSPRIYLREVCRRSSRVIFKVADDNFSGLKIS